MVLCNYLPLQIPSHKSRQRWVPQWQRFLATGSVHGIRLFGVTARGSGGVSRQGCPHPVLSGVGLGAVSIDLHPPFIQAGCVPAPQPMGHSAGRNTLPSCPLTFTEGGTEGFHKPHTRLSLEKQTLYETHGKGPHSKRKLKSF